MEETVIGEVQKVLKYRSISSHFVQRKFTRLRLTHIRRFVFAVGSLTGVLKRESLLPGV